MFMEEVKRLERKLEQARSCRGAGLFGTWGLAFARRESRQGRLGFFRWYGRGQQEKVFIEAGGRRYVLEPETPAEFIRAIEAARAGRRP